MTSVDAATNQLLAASVRFHAGVPLPDVGVHRQGVTLPASYLHKAGPIRYSRGKLKVPNRQDLEKASCDCYRAFQSEFEGWSA
jgi:hypothetical protein